MASRGGGFPCTKFCNQAKSDFFHCLICLDVCRSPVTCHSGAHLFCHDCLAESLRHNPSCPTCRQPLEDPIPCPFASTQVSALDMICLHDECTWKGTCGRLDSHLDKDCPHEPIECTGEGGCGARVPRREMATHQQFACLQSCPNSKTKAQGSDGETLDTCDVRLSRNDLIDHLQNHCKLRLIHCPHPSCEFSAAYNRMPAHVEVCPLAPVSCPRQCDSPNLTRGCLVAHKGDCPNEPVPCVHAPLGCSHIAPRGQIGQHEQDIGVHFVALSKAFVQLQQSHGQLIGQLQEMFKQNLQVQTKQFEEGQQVSSALFEERLQVIMEERLHALSSLMEERLQVHEERLKAVEARLEDHTTLLQPLVLEARAKAKQAEARAQAPGLKCYQCGQPATHLYKNNKEPMRNDSYRMNGFSGTCSSHIDCYHSKSWEKL